MSARMRRAGFTLIELMIVVATFGVLGDLVIADEHYVDHETVAKPVTVFVQIRHWI